MRRRLGEGRHPALFAQPDEGFGPELEDGQGRIDDEMVVEDREAGELPELAGNGQLATRGRSLEEDELHRAGMIPACLPAYPPSIDADLWREAQEQLTRNRERAPRNNTRHQYLLRALLICGRCGRRMIGATDGGGRRRYVCSARYPRHLPGACHGRSITAKPLEDQVWCWITRLLSEPALLRARFEESRGDPAVDSADEREGARIERHLKALDREVGRLIDAYQAAAIDLNELKERRQQIEDHARHLRERLDEIGRQRSEREREIRLLQGLEAFCAGIRDALVAPPFEIRQKVLRLVVDRVILQEDMAVIRHIVPMTPIGLQPYLG